MKCRIIFRSALTIVLFVVAGGAADARSFGLGPCPNYSPQDAAYLVNEIYKQVLEREADPGGLVTFAGLISNGDGNTCPWKIFLSLGSSPEYISRFVEKQTPRQAVVLMYRHFLFREPESENVINHHIGSMNANGWQKTIHGIAVAESARKEAWVKSVFAKRAAPKTEGVKALVDKGCKFFLGRKNDYLCTTQESFALCETLKKEGKGLIERCRLAGVNEEVDKALVSQGCKRIGIGQYSCVGQKGFDACEGFLKNKKVTICKRQSIIKTGK